jgi:flagellar protein FlgJ
MIARIVSPVGPSAPQSLSSAPATAASRTTSEPPRDAKLQQAVSALEGVFVQQLYKAMRETVPQGEGIVSGGAGEEMFTALMDEHLAAETPKHWERGLSDALYRQLSRHLVTATHTSDPTSDAASTASLPDTVLPSDL